MSEKDRKQLGRIALRQRAAKGGAEPEDRVALLKSLSEEQGVPALDLSQLVLRLSDLEHLPREIAEQHTILPVLTRDERLFVAMANPREKRVIDELEFVTGKRVFPYVAPKAELLEVIEKAYTYRKRGEPYYVGPNCPPETLEKMGVHADGTPATSSPPSPNSLSEVSDAGIVIDDRLSGAPPQHDSLDESDFGDLSEELSGVTDVGDLESAISPESATVLVVDDEPDIRRLLRQLLASKGYRVVEAHTGDEALRVLKEMTPDVLVLDAMLPGVHGFEIARRLKASQRYSSVPIVMVSAVYRGWRVAEDLQESFGVDHYIEKPFRMNELLKAVETALQSEKGTTDVEDISAEAEKELNAGVQAYRQGRFEEAAGHLERGISVDPVAYRLHFHLGLLYGKMGRIYEAIGALERAVQINSKHFSGVKNLAILYQKAGFRNKATEMWERALRISPDTQTRDSIRDHLLSLLQ